jgi:uncharacterized membrane protein YdbT with pleckstrin-like domain
VANYVESNLLKNELIVYSAKNHWIIFLSLRALLTLFIAPIIAMLTNEFAITNKRVIIKEGLIARRTVEINLPKIESINVDQSILGRILGYGNMTVVGTGGTREEFLNISSPMQFRKSYQQAEDQLTHGGQPKE